MTQLLRALRLVPQTVTDNPLPARDASVRLRSLSGLGAAVLGVVVLAAVATLAVVVNAPNPVRLMSWGAPDPAGRWVVVAVFIAGLLLTGVALPIAGAVSLASERERGTLDLLRTSSLTPGQLAMGKLLATLLSGAPVLLAMTPLLAVGALLGDVSVLPVVGFVALAWAHAFAAASVGVLAGAWARRVRTATGPAFLGAVLLVGVPVTLPLAVLAIAWGGGDATLEAVPGVLSSLLLAVIVAVASLVGARAALAPRALGRRRFRAPVVTVALGLAPVLAAAAFAVMPGDANEEVWGNLLLSGWVFAWLLVVVIDMASAGHGDDERQALNAWGVITTRAVVGLTLSAGVLAVALVHGRAGLPFTAVAPSIGAGLLVLSLGLACAAALTGVVGLVVVGRWARVFVTVLLLTLLAAAPLGLGVVYWSLGGDSDVLPLISLNPLAQIGSVATELDLLDLPWRARHTVLGGARVPTLVPGVLAYAGLLVSGLTVLVARRRTG